MYYFNFGGEIFICRFKEFMENSKASIKLYSLSNKKNLYLKQGKVHMYMCLSHFQYTFKRSFFIFNSGLFYGTLISC